MALATKIHSSFWSDDRIGRLNPRQKLAMLWLLTNKEINNVGFIKVSRRQFNFDTKMPLEVLEGALSDLVSPLKPLVSPFKGDTSPMHPPSRGFVVEVENGTLAVLAVNYVRHQFGDRKLSKNKMLKNLQVLTCDLSENMKGAILTRYPDLAHSESEAPCIPLQGGCIPPEQSRAEQSTDLSLEGGAGETIGRNWNFAKDCLELLNAGTGSKFPVSHPSLLPIAERLSEVGNKVAEVKKMILRQVKMWRDDSKMRAYLRPATLFGENFNDYYGQRDQPLPARGNDFTSRTRELEGLIEKSRANRESLYFNEEARTGTELEQLQAWRKELLELKK